jgi:hypothetical protein
MRLARVAGTGVLAAAGLVGIVLALTAQVPPGKLPGLVSADPFPKGCVDCHKLQADGKDYRLNVGLKQVAKHPDITSIVKNVPTDCTMCHKAGATAGLISSAVHKAHYEAKGDGAFVKAYGGECLNCHTVNPTTFEVKVKSAPKNW